MSKQRVLIVDDEPDILSLLEMTLSRMGLETRGATNLAEARRALARDDVDLCLTDMKLPDGSGIDLVRAIQERENPLPVAVITAYGNVEAAVESLKAGAFDFVSKPVDLEILRRLVRSAVRQADHHPDRRSRDVLLGDSAPMQRLRGLIVKVSRGQAPVYITGESGTGKELVARLIHEKSPRSEGPFVPVNCGAIPSELMESEFFGHRKGSFTGAVTDKAGLFQAAEGGTLFLDEIAELPLSMQVKLLRALQERSVRPVGAEHEVPVDVRVVSATHTSLEELVRSGTFREDLFYRINVIQLQVPPLRERRQDIPLLIDHVLARLAERSGERPPSVAPEAHRALSGYDFPGNVRELENILERALTLCEDGVIHETDLQLRPAPGPDNGTASLDDQLEDLQRESILRALEENRYNKTATARALGITFRALRYRLKKLGIE
ncbi:MAG TPA: sigma-54 dependent transcriptional regulator [Gammaproteobacteria bacterium]|nr:sigma-54 dependent transcriptional regulator [Gammaproteobacteria bacterium]